MTTSQKEVLKRYGPGFALLCIAYIIFLFFGKDGAFLTDSGTIERGLYYTASDYISHFYSSTGESPFLEWLYNFAFHFAPGHNPEKPFFIFLLGYFKMALNAVGVVEKEPAIFNHILVTLLTFLTWFYLVRRKMALLGLAVGVFILTCPPVEFFSAHGQHTILGIFPFP